MADEDPTTTVLVTGASKPVSQGSVVLWIQVAPVPDRSKYL